MKASTSVRHIVIPCSASTRADLIPDIIRCYGSEGRSIVFTETKESASQLAGILSGSRPLHGDIQQTQREVTLEGFRNGKFMTLAATNVAARGLDINEVQLIIQVSIFCFEQSLAIGLKKVLHMNTVRHVSLFLFFV